jgi:hypothetical protein
MKAGTWITSLMLCIEFKKYSEITDSVTERLSKLENDFKSQNRRLMYLNIGEVALIIMLMIVIFIKF